MLRIRAPDPLLAVLDGLGGALAAAVRPLGRLVDVAALEEHFAHRRRAVVCVPFDPHLEAGSSITLGQLKPATQDAYLQLAAVIGDGLRQT